MSNERDKAFAHFAGLVENPPPQDVMALGYLMRDWLKACVADPDTAIDTGAGMQAFDLWVTMGGKEVYIQITGWGPPKDAGGDEPF